MSRAEVVTVPPEDQVLTVKETAAYFGVDGATIKRWEKQVPEFPKPIPLPCFEREQVRFYRIEIIAFREMLRTKRVKRIKKKFPK